jgi:hypothetical protein
MAAADSTASAAGQGMRATKRAAKAAPVKSAADLKLNHDTRTLCRQEARTKYLPVTAPFGERHVYGLRGSLRARVQPDAPGRAAEVVENVAGPRLTSRL